MALRIKCVCALALPLLLYASCLYSRTTGPAVVVNKTVAVNNGNAVLTINGQTNENLYSFSSYDRIAADEHYYDNPLITAKATTKKETQYLSAGERYTFSVLPTEVVTVNITSLDDNDVEISVFEHGEEKVYFLQGTNRLGLFITFQNR